MSGELLHLTALTAKELRAVASVTLAHYDESANSFWQGTRDHDVSQNVEALLRHLRGERPYTILDFGCGPGRDLVRLRKLGHEAVGLEGAEQFVQWPAITQGARFYTKISWRWIFRVIGSTVSSPMLHCFMSQPRSYRECCRSFGVVSR